LCAKRGKLGLALDAVEPSSSAAALGSGISPRRSWTAAQIWSHGSLGRHFAANGRSVSGANGAILALNWGRAAGARARAAMCGGRVRGSASARQRECATARVRGSASAWKRECVEARSRRDALRFYGTPRASRCGMPRSRSTYWVAACMRSPCAHVAGCLACLCIAMLPQSIHAGGIWMRCG